MQFARNPISPTAASELAAVLGPAPTQSLWMLVDSALVNGGKLRILMSYLRWEGSAALQSSLFEPFGEHGPRLIALPKDPGTAMSGLQQVIALDPRSPATSLIASTAGSNELAGLCAYLAEVLVDGDLPVHCRFADTRVLPQLLRVLSTSQARRVSGCIAGWSWHDHLGKANHWPLNSDDAASSNVDSSPSLKLDQDQFKTMLDASEPDTMFSLLLENTPELVPHVERGCFREHLSLILARADKCSLDSPNDRLQFVVLSLSCGDGFYEHPGLQSTWAAVGQQNRMLVDEMKDWSDSLWEQLQGGRRSSIT